MSEPQASLWNRDNSDVLPEYQLRYGHALFRVPWTDNLMSKLVHCLALGRATYNGPFNESAIPGFNGHRVFGVADELHLVVARIGDCWSVFGPHNLFFSSRKWTKFNVKNGGPMAVINQLDEKGRFFYVIFDRGRKQADAVVEGESIRIINDEAISVYVEGELIHRSRAMRTMPDAAIIELIRQDSNVSIHGNRVTIAPRFGCAQGGVELVRHLIFVK